MVPGLPFYIRDDDPPAKRHILRAAMKLFSEHGLAGTSIRDIARESGFRALGCVPVRAVVPRRPKLLERECAPGEGRPLRGGRALEPHRFGGGRTCAARGTR